MGNLDGRPTDGLTGTTGPGLILRSTFAELNRFEEAMPLFLSPRLTVASICRKTGLLAQPSCPTILEKFLPGAVPAACNHREDHEDPAAVVSRPQGEEVHLLQPSAGLQMIMDPHIPDDIEAYALKFAGNIRARKTEWLIDRELAGSTGENIDQFLWPLSKGMHLAQARVWQDGAEPLLTPAVPFVVK
jgi:penicillin-binding protein 1C